MSIVNINFLDILWQLFVLVVLIGLGVFVYNLFKKKKRS